MKAILLFALLGASIASIEGSKCDPNIEAKIKALNNNIPKKLIQAAIENGKEVVVGTTAGYYPKDTKCFFSTFNLDSFTGVRIPKTGCAAITSHSLKEIEGATYDPNSGIKRIHVTQQGGVTSLYKCEENGVAGDPEGVIKVSESTKDYSALIRKAKDDLEAVGIKIVDKYPSACP